MRSSQEGRTTHSYWGNQIGTPRESCMFVVLPVSHHDYPNRHLTPDAARELAADLVAAADDADRSAAEVRRSLLRR